MDLIKQHQVVYDMGAQLMRYRNVESPMVYGNEKATVLKIVVIRDQVLSPCSETMTCAKLEGDLGSHRFYIRARRRKQLPELYCIKNVGNTKQKWFQ